MAAGLPELSERVYRDVVSSGVLPDPTYVAKLSWEQIKRRVPVFDGSVEYVDRSLVVDLLGVRDKRDFGDLSEKIWPPRTKTDLSLRRTRLLDWVLYFRGYSRSSELEFILFNTKEGWDLIFVTNLLVATAVFGLDWFKRWLWLGALDGDLSHYIAVAKKVHDIGKTTGIADDNWTWYVESATLSGYRNPPFPGFDVLEETKALANGGEKHEYYGNTWRALCVEYLPMKYHAVQWVSFKDWVIRAEWLTSGASSVGYLRITCADGTKVKVKARKNMVADVVDLGELADDAYNYTGQENSTIIKSELGKLRLAVAGDIYNYLKMTWVTGLLGGAYYDWPGNTSEESFVQQTKRLAKMLDLCATSFGLPYDYAGFDHQPETSEILGIVEHLCSHAKLNVPYHGYAEFEHIVATIINGFNTATLTVKLDGHDNTFPVTGGLMSGLRWTSIVGNAWNTVMTGLATKLLVAWGLDVEKVERYIRGDDSAIFVPNWATGAAMNIAYDAVGAKAGVGKFSLQANKMEFLRVWFENRCHGYPMRAIPGLTQRKPWSSNPWSEDMVIKAIYECIRTIKRRAESCSKNLDDIWKCLRHVWCANHGLPDAVTWTPVHAGGFGIEAPRIGENWRIEPPVPKADTTGGIVVDNQLAWRKNKIIAYAKERYDLDLGDRADELARQELASTITSDNVPALAKIVRSDWLFTVRKARCKAVMEKTDLGDIFPVVDLNAYAPRDIEDLLSRLRAECPLFGTCPEVEVARSDYDRFRPKMGFRDWVKYHFPRIWVGLGKFHKSWHISEQLDYLSGSLKLAPTILHPALVGVLAKLTACSLRPQRRSVRCASLWYGSALEGAVFNCPLSRVTYGW